MKKPTVGQQDIVSFLRHATGLRATQSDGVPSVLTAP